MLFNPTKSFVISLSFLLVLLRIVTAVPLDKRESTKCHWPSCLATLGVAGGSCARAIFEDKLENPWQTASCSSIAFNDVKNLPTSCSLCLGKKASSHVPKSAESAENKKETPDSEKGCQIDHCIVAFGYNGVSCSRTLFGTTGNPVWNALSCGASSVSNLFYHPKACKGCSVNWIKGEVEAKSEGKKYVPPPPKKELASSKAETKKSEIKIKPKDKKGCNALKLEACAASFGFAGVSCSRMALDKEAIFGWSLLSCAASGMSILENLPSTCHGCNIHWAENEAEEFVTGKKSKSTPKLPINEKKPIPIPLPLPKKSAPQKPISSLPLPIKKPPKSDPGPSAPAPSHYNLHPYIPSKSNIVTLIRGVYTPSRPPPKP